MSRRGAAALLVVASACLEANPLAPPFQTPPVTTVLLVEDSKGSLQGWVVGPEDSSDLALPTTGTIHALAYDAPPERLLLPHGPLAPTPEGTRPFPSPAQGLRADLAARPLAWEPPTALSALLARFPLPELSPEACVEQGGCLASESGSPICRPTCAHAEIAAPAPPAAPCFAGWTPGERYCAPTPPPMAPCPSGQRYDLDLETCAEHVECPDTLYYEPPGGGAFVYVQPGAEDGNGSRARPFPDLQTALQSAPRGSSILLSAGTHALAGPLETVGARTQVVGVCPSATTLEVAETWTLRASDIALSRLRLVGPAGEDGMVVRASTVSLTQTEVVQHAERAIYCATSSVSVDEVVFRQDGANTELAIVADHSWVHVRRSTLEGHGGIYLGERGRGRLEDLTFFGRPGIYAHAVYCFLCEALAVSRARIRSSRASGVGAVGAKALTLTDIGVWNAEGTSVAIGACEPQVHCRDRPCPDHCRAETSPYTQAELRGIYVEAALDTATSITGVRASIADLVILGTGAEGLLAQAPDGYALEADVARVYVEHALNGGLNVEGLDSHVHVDFRDVFIVATDRVRHERKPAIKFEFAAVTLERAVVRDSPWHGVGVWCGPTRMSDVDVRGADGSGLLIRPGATTFASRIYVQDTAEAAIDVDAQRPSPSILVSCEGRYPTGEALAEVSDVRSSSTSGGAVVAGGARLELARFDLTAIDRGLHVTRTGAARFEDGVSRGATEGLVLPFGASPAGYLDGVRIEGALRPLVRE